jgi:hypothetical protein
VGVGWRRRLTMASRGSGGAPARGRAEEGRRSNAAWWNV